VSPDLSEKIDRGFKISKKDYVVIDFESQGEIVETYYLSLDTAARFGITKSELLPLTDDFPAYALEARPECITCFKNIIVDDETTAGELPT